MKSGPHTEGLAVAATHAVHALIGFGAWVTFLFAQFTGFFRVLPDSWFGEEFPTLFFWSGAGLCAIAFGVFGPFIYRWYSPDHRSRGTLAEVKAKSRRRR